MLIILRLLIGFSILFFFYDLSFKLILQFLGYNVLVFELQCYCFDYFEEL